LTEAASFLQPFFIFGWLYAFRDVASSPTQWYRVTTERYFRRFRHRDHFRLIIEIIYCFATRRYYFTPLFSLQFAARLFTGFFATDFLHDFFAFITMPPPDAAVSLSSFFDAISRFQMPYFVLHDTRHFTSFSFILRHFAAAFSSFLLSRETIFAFEALRFSRAVSTECVGFFFL